jgi:hypothetical protein
MLVINNKTVKPRGEKGRFAVMCWFSIKTTATL